VNSTSENIIKILSHKWNKFHIHQQRYWILCLLHFLCFSNMKGFRAVMQHTVIIKNMTSQSFC
jgi:hypothetical protein